MLQGQVESSRESRFFILYILIDVILSHISLYPRRGKVAEMLRDYIQLACAA